MKKRIKFNILLTSIFIFIIVGCIAKFVYTKTDMYKYNKAKNMINNGKYEEAIYILENKVYYKDSEELVLSAKLEIVNNLVKEGKIEEALEKLNQVGKDTNNATKNLYVELEMTLGDIAFNNDNLEVAKIHYENANVNDRKLEECKVLLTLQGSYGSNMIIKGSYVYIQDIHSTNKKVSKYKIQLNDTLNKITSKEGLEFEIKENELIQKTYDLYTKDFKYIELKKVSDSTKIPNEISDPKIGMTKQEVENSTWKKPSKINTSTYSWGVTEQWVYPGKGYIYFKNGKVSSISESK